ncbi:MAG: polyphenol oxidase family protein [Treponema sp.]|jgi:YfiH family protein|nr:polyphenol oxidase family protein [Treponema sp.]
MLPNWTRPLHKTDALGAGAKAGDVQLYPFHLVFQSPSLAYFPFIMDGAALTEGKNPIGCGISSRSAGTMSLRDPRGRFHRQRLYTSLGLDPMQVFTCTQVHSREVLALEADSPCEGPQADGMISREPGACLMVTVADCLPVYLYDTESGGFALVHSGWKGTGIALNALKLMEARWHTRPQGVAAVLGPCIGACCYPVDAARRRAFDQDFGGPSGAYPLGPVVKGPALDLQAANARLLVNAGVRHIALCKDCTFTDERLGSFRREGPAYTAMAALAGPLSCLGSAGASN